MKNIVKGCLENNDLSWHLNELKDSANLTSSGILFHMIQILLNIRTSSENAGYHIVM